MITAPRRIGAAAIVAMMLTAVANPGVAQPVPHPKPRPTTSTSAAKPSAPKPSATKQAAASPKQAATGESVPNAMQGFSKNRQEPIQIDAASLEVRDRDKVATFRGKVHVVQGDTDMRCNVLTVFYEQTEEAGNAPVSPLPNPSETQRIRRLEARGNVIVTQKDQVATGDSGDFDMRKNLITLRGHVAVNQGKNVLRGDRLLVDMTTGVSHIESDTGRVQGLFQPSKRDDDPKSHELNLVPQIH